VSAQGLDRLPPGPVLVVADNAAIASSAPAWAAAFKAAGRPYRVRLAGASTASAMAAEARSLGAVAVMAAGTPATLLLAQSTASHLSLPFARAEILYESPIVDG